MDKNKNNYILNNKIKLKKKKKSSTTTTTTLFSKIAVTKFTIVCKSSTRSSSTNEIRTKKKKRTGRPTITFQF